MAIAEGTVGSCRWRLSVRSSLPLREWPDELRAETRRRLAELPAAQTKEIVQGSQALVMTGTRDSSNNVSLSIGAAPFIPALVCPARLPDPESGRAQPFLFGATTPAVDSICWLPNSGARVYTTETLVVITDPRRRAYVLALDHDPACGGDLVAVGRHGELIFRTHYQGATEVERARTQSATLRAVLSKIGHGPIPDGGEWVLSAGWHEGRLHHFVERKPGGGGGGGAGGDAILPERVIKLDAVSGGREDVQIAIGQVAKRVQAVEATLDDGSVTLATVVRAPELPVNFFVALASPPRAVRRFEAFAENGLSLGRIMRDALPADLPDALRRNLRS